MKLAAGGHSASVGSDRRDTDGDGYPSLGSCAAPQSPLCSRPVSHSLKKLCPEACVPESQPRPKLFLGAERREGADSRGRGRDSGWEVGVLFEAGGGATSQGEWASLEARKVRKGASLELPGGADASI